MYDVYIINSEKLDKYYIGFSANLSVRIRKHNCISKGFSSNGRPWILVYSESYSTKREAMAREKAIKKMEESGAN